MNTLVVTVIVSLDFAVKFRTLLPYVIEPMDDVADPYCSEGVSASHMSGDIVFFT